jgi:SAM-dependent methyltransferase
VPDACPACGGHDVRALLTSTDWLYGTTTDPFDVVECLTCRLMRLNPIPPPEELARYYPPNYWYTEDGGTASRLEQAYRRFVLGDHLRFVERALRGSSADGAVLDVGCGGGLFLQMLEERHAGGMSRPVIGLDFSLDAARTAWKRAAVPTVCASLSQAPFEAGSCAAITMFHVLEHVYDPMEYLDTAHRLLAPDGTLIVQIPNAACWQFLLLGGRWNGAQVPRHLIHFRARDLDELLDACGFEVVRHKHFSLRDNPTGLATSLASFLDPMSRQMWKVVEKPWQRLAKNLAYLALTGICLPFTMLEAACRAGSTVMVEARKKA